VEPNSESPRDFGSPDVVLVLPRNYGWGMRNPEDKIWECGSRMRHLQEFGISRVDYSRSMAFDWISFMMTLFIRSQEDTKKFTVERDDRLENHRRMAFRIRHPRRFTPDRIGKPAITVKMPIISILPISIAKIISHL